MAILPKFSSIGPIVTLTTSTATCFLLLSNNNHGCHGFHSAFAPTPPSRRAFSSSSPSSSTTALQLGDFFGWGGGDDNKQTSDPTTTATTSTTPQEETIINKDEGYDDPVDKIFGFFFGAKEEEPMGLKRFGPDKYPEQYPATVTEWADPVATDDKIMAEFRPLLKNTNLETRALTLSYDANKNGWNPAAFHKAVDKKGAGVVRCVSTDGQVFGGYNPKGWVGYGEARGSIAAFLYIMGEGGGMNNGGPATKLRKVGGKSLAQVDAPEAGPSFGADSLVIPLAADNPRLARSKLGSYYERRPDGANSLFGDKKAYVQLKEFRVYHGVYEEGEYIPFTDAEPFALY